MPDTAAPASALIDRFGRRVSYLRVSVTDRCDLRCAYCLPKDFHDYREPADWLDFDELTRLIGAFAQLGVGRVRLTGGEPLLRRDLPMLARRLKALPGLHDLSLSTNGTQLERHAEALARAGIDRVNISLDSLDRACIAELTGRDTLGAVMAGLRAARAAGLAPIKLNMVALRGVNDHEIEPMAEFCFEHGFILRLIETMPMGRTGRDARHLDLGPVRERLVTRFGLVPEAQELGGGPARYWRSADGRARIGFITPISQHFCASCNRVRLAVDGTLYPCLGEEERFEFRPLLRGGASDAELADAIRLAIERKPERHHFREAPERIVRFMSQTGG
ncbi:cyclic pyranopterin monophosphate synthase [Chitiniphilus shinanonensis]|uniref:GTP 3',8-cyclase n=1 Tax=Chitiniphilus shinanonensis TaxID=553088 RepID=A0ABQ6BR94_9NEIS|nr:GTP 3',8-cyclase MoaA [Chitiniphilus shinanonensis]GLS04184.1 cyclic pyranopterin monophosphate synthase [Chitiniphilus shinanonensis]